MSDGQGGIGSIGLPEINEEDAGGRTVPRYSTTKPPEMSGDILLAEAALRTIEASNETIRQAIEGLAGRVTESDEIVSQLLGQVARIESLLPQYSQAFAQFDARLNVLAQAVMRNNRYAALDLATKSRGPGEQAASVIKNAEAYARFIEPPEPEQTDEAEVGETQH